MEIIFDGENIPEQAMLDKMEEALLVCLENEGIDSENVEVSLTFTDKEEIHMLNREYRNVDSVTDVLSFPQYESADDFPDTGEIIMGDVVICVEKAVEQAEELGHSTERELVYLFTHSILHLMGYDHMEDDEKELMRGKEEAVMDAIGLKRQ